MLFLQHYNYSTLKTFGLNITLLEKGQGILVLVINTQSCQKIFDQVFNTDDFGGYRNLIWALETMQKGQLVILASLVRMGTPKVIIRSYENCCYMTIQSCQI